MDGATNMQEHKKGMRPLQMIPVVTSKGNQAGFGICDFLARIQLECTGPLMLECFPLRLLYDRLRNNVKGFIK